MVGFFFSCLGLYLGVKAVSANGINLRFFFFSSPPFGLRGFFSFFGVYIAGVKAFAAEHYKPYVTALYYRVTPNALLP